jgi:Protein of unknown function (DUF4229)
MADTAGSAQTGGGPTEGVPAPPMGVPAAPMGVPAAPTGGPASPPRLAPALALYTLGRLGVFVVLVALLWVAGLTGFLGLVLALVLSVPVSYLLLRPLRERATEALAARSVARRTAKEQLRTRLAGTEADD